MLIRQPLQQRAGWVTEKGFLVKYNGTSVAFYKCLLADFQHVGFLLQSAFVWSRSSNVPDSDSNITRIIHVFIEQRVHEENEIFSYL